MAGLSDIEMDSLKEIGNVGVGNAATALSKMINKKVDITIPDAEFVSIQRFPEKAGGPETVVDCLYVPTTGDINGNALFFFRRECALKFVDLIMGKEPGTTKEMDDMDKSSFQEMANIVSAAYLNSMANMLGMAIMPEPPKLASDMLQSVIDGILAGIAKHANEVLYIQTQIKINDINVHANFTLLLDTESLNVLMSKLKEKYGI